jgi:C1A family cysteine protease/N-acetylneuraminic acid mutarotase
MIRERLKKAARAMAILAVLSTTVLSSSALSGISKEERQNKSKEIHQATGLKEPTKEDLKWMEENMVQVKKVLPNELGLQRANEVRKKKGLKVLGKDKAVHKGEEVIPMSSNQSTATKIASTLKSEAAESDSPAVADVEALSSTSLPTYVDNSALPYFPPIRNQEGIGSCASFASTYYQATYMTAMARGWNVKDNNDNTNKFSPKWTYNLVNGGVNDGSTPQGNYRVMLENGIATWDKFPYCGDGSVPKNYLEWSTDEEVWADALNYKMDKAGYVKVADGTDTPVTSPESPALNDIKQLLNNGYVLTCSTRIYSWIWTTIKDNPSTDADNEFVDKDVACYMQDTPSYGHMMTIVGYNDDIWVDINNNNIVDPGENGAFRIANSWGNTWQDSGFAWIAYDALNKVSAVNGAPAATEERQSIWEGENLVYWITAKTSYTPDLIGKITLSHAKRNQVKLELGMQEADGTNAVTFNPLAVNYSGSAECDFDGPEAVSGGTEVPCDATFVFDFSDMFKGKDISGITKNWTVKVTDTNLDGSSALVKNFSVIDSLGNAASCSQVNQTVDGASILFSSSLALQSNTVKENEWIFKNRMPFEIEIKKSYQFGDKIYAVGYLPDESSDGLICYDPLSERISWICSFSFDYDDWDLSVGYDNKIYLFAGSNVQVYDINTGLMSSKSTIPGRITGSAVVTMLNGKIYFINGYSEDNNGDNFLYTGVKVYDPVMDTWSSTVDTNIARTFSGTAVLNEKIYLFGGYDSQSNECVITEEYDPATNQWTIISNYLPCSINSKFLSLGNKIYAFGMDNINQVFEYNPDLNQWNKHYDIPEPYYEFQAESLNGKIYVMGGRMTYFPDYYSKNVLEFTPSVSEVVSAPAFSIEDGTYTSIQSITLSCATEGATIRYTTDGSIPTSASEIYTVPVTIAGSKIIKVYAQKGGMIDSNVSVSSYLLSIQVGDVNGDGIVDVFDYPLLVKYANGTINDFPVEDDLWAGDLDGDGLINNTDVSLMLQKIHGEISFFPKEEVKSPNFSPAEGTYTSFQSITLSCPTKGATIRYTTDGSIPTSDSKIYTGRFNITKSTTIKAFAQKAGLPDSGITSATYILSIKIGDVDGNGFIDTFDYLLLLKYSNGTIDDFPVEDDLWIGDLDGDGLINNTDVSLMRQRIYGEIGFFPKEQVKAPSFSLAEGTYSSAQTVTLESTTEGAIIRYTADGTMPTSTSELYTGPINVSNSKIIKAYASKEGMVDSDIASATYTIISKVENPVISPTGGTYTSIQAVTLSCATEGATIRYTTDGTTPTSTSPLYTDPITVAGSKAIKAYAEKDDMMDSDISTAEYELAIRVGDVNGDGNVDAVDYALLKIYLENPPYDFPVDDDMWAGDLNGDGSIDAIDLFLMKQFIDGQIAYFPKE